MLAVPPKRCFKSITSNLLIFCEQGHASSWDEIIVTGDLEKADFIAFYVANGRAVAAIAAKREKEAAAFLELLRRDRALPPGDLRSLDLVARLES